MTSPFGVEKKQNLRKSRTPQKKRTWPFMLALRFVSIKNQKGLK